MDAVEVIEDVASGRGLDADAAGWFAEGLARGDVTDAQAGAFAMAVRLRGLDTAGRTALTAAMRDSGDTLTWDLPGPVVDKHSTGGIGDCTTLLLAPALAACGVFVPMISGRGLAHSGGTLDKLEAIPGLRVEFEEEEFQRVVAEVGCAIVAASGEVAPADRRLYAIRDVTATVPSVDLIVASILSKKLAAGLEALILDVKTGSGAFMPSPDEARELSRALVVTARTLGCRTRALVTAMDQPLAPAAGNALEVAEVMRVLEGDEGRLRDLTVALGGGLLSIVGRDGGEEEVETAIRSGAAAERFGAMVRAQGGPADFLETWRRRLPAAPIVREVAAERDGVLHSVDGKALGMAVVRLGGGRLRGGESIDPAVGIDAIARIGVTMRRGDVLARIHAADEAAADRAEAALRAAIVLGDDGADPLPLILEEVTP